MWIKQFWKSTNTFLCPQEKVENDIYLFLVLGVVYFCLRTDGLNFVQNHIFPSYTKE